MKNTLIILLTSVVLMACPGPKNDDAVSPQGTTNGIPEAGQYNSFDTNIAPDNFKYDSRTNQWEWKNGIKLQITPSAFGRLKLNKNGTYEFLDLKKTGTFKQDKNSKKIAFTGFMADASGYYKIKKGWCTLMIQAIDKDGTILSIIYEKKSDYPQPDIKEPNAGFTGTIVNMGSKSSTDYINVATGKTFKTHANISFPITGSSKYSVTIYKKNYLDADEIYPVIEIKDMEGTIVKKFEKTWRDPDQDKWDIGDYWYGMLSPNGTRLALIGYYKRHFVIFDPKYVDPYPMVSIIDIKTGNEIYSYALDKNDNSWGPGWTPNGELVMPRKGGGIAILDANLKNVKSIYSKNVSEARMNQFGKVLFHEGKGVFTMDANGGNIEPVKDGTGNLNISKLYDLGWNSDGKSMAFVVEEYLRTYNILLHNPASKEYTYLRDSKGDTYQFNSPFLNWQ
jgi:hypothetical protein